MTRSIVRKEKRQLRVKYWHCFAIDLISFRFDGFWSFCFNVYRHINYCFCPQKVCLSIDETWLSGERRWFGKDYFLFFRICRTKLFAEHPAHGNEWDVDRGRNTDTGWTSVAFSSSSAQNLNISVKELCHHQTLP